MPRPLSTPQKRLRAERWILAGFAALSLAWSAWWWAQIGSTPGAAMLVERAGSELTASYERALARSATPEALALRLSQRLDETPRDWVVIEALSDLATEQGIILPPDLIARRDALDAEDNGWLATGVNCAACAWDLRQCDLSATLACGVAVNLTVVGDVVALTREGTHYLAGDEVDQVDVAISFVGLAATGLVVATGGTSLAVKGGSALLRVAHRTGRLAPDILAVFRRAFAFGIDWARLPAVRSADDLALLARPGILEPAVEVAQDLGRMNTRLGTRQALHLLANADTPAEARALARGAEALGARTTGAFEMLGKSRFLRLGLRLSDEVWALLAGVMAAAASLAGFAASILLRVLRPALRLLIRLGLRITVR
ncbi:MAG: hypothetical protein R3D60_12715 [Paracoccaceae bacterium]